MKLNRKQLSLLITFFSMSLFILLLFNIHLGHQDEEDGYVIELNLEEEEDPEQKLLEEIKALEELANAAPIKSHMAFNEANKPSYGNPEPLKTLEEILEEQEMSEEGDASEDTPLSNSEFAAKIKELADRRREKQALLGDKEANKEVMTNNLARKNTSVSYSLVDRTHLSLPIPIYTCIEGGKVVINIIVDPTGKVLEAEVNKKSSNTLNGCLVDNAIAYALKSKFTNGAKASQKGTITYLFQSK
ncbi:energy transducer TonB [Arenibacter sp. 6A1]|nr:energy transducer TonB [Arenibacter sp. 6A1]